MKTPFVPWWVWASGLAGVAYVVTRPKAAPALPPAQKPANVPILVPAPPTAQAPGGGGGVLIPTGTTAPPIATVPPIPTTSGGSLAPDVATTIAVLLDSRVHPSVDLLEVYRAIAAGPDGKQNPNVVAQIIAKENYMKGSGLDPRGMAPAPVATGIR